MRMAFMSHIASGLGWMFAVLAAAGSIYTAITAILVHRFFDTRRSPPAEDQKAPESHDYDTVTFLKPLHGAEAGLRQNLSAHFFQDLHNPLQIVFGLQRQDDPAADIARAVMAEHPDVPASVAIGDRQAVPNRKVANLIQMFPLAAGTILVVTDSDIRPPPDHLRRVLDALDRPDSGPEVGIVTCPYFGVGESGVWSEIAGMGVSYQFLPNVIAGVSLGMARPCMGSTIALSRETLERIGGFDAFGAVLADDYAMGAAVRALGLRSVLAPSLVAHGCSENTLGEVFRHELRWARTIRGVDFAGHAGSLVTHPAPLAMIGALLTGFAIPALIVLAVAVVARFLLAAVIDRAARRRSRLLWLLPVRDMLSFAVFVGSFLGRTVEWRGEKFHVTTDGDLSPA
jgi:ceramide glucosyltransferase